MQTAIAGGPTTIQVRLPPRPRRACAIITPAAPGAVPVGVQVAQTDLPIPFPGAVKAPQEPRRQAHTWPPGASARDVLVGPAMGPGAPEESPMDGARVAPPTPSVRIAAAVPGARGLGVREGAHVPGAGRIAMALVIHPGAPGAREPRTAALAVALG